MGPPAIAAVQADLAAARAVDHALSAGRAAFEFILSAAETRELRGGRICTWWAMAAAAAADGRDAVALAPSFPQGGRSAQFPSEHGYEAADVAVVRLASQLADCLGAAAAQAGDPGDRAACAAGARQAAQIGDLLRQAG